MHGRGSWHVPYTLLLFVALCLWLLHWAYSFIDFQPAPPINTAILCFLLLMWAIVHTLMNLPSFFEGKYQCLSPCKLVVLSFILSVVSMTEACVLAVCLGKALVCNNIKREITKSHSKTKQPKATTVFVCNVLEWSTSMPCTMGEWEDVFGSLQKSKSSKGTKKHWRNQVGTQCAKLCWTKLLVEYLLCRKHSLPG